MFNVNSLLIFWVENGNISNFILVKFLYHICIELTTEF